MTSVCVSRERQMQIDHENLIEAIRSRGVATRKEQQLLLDATIKKNRCVIELLDWLVCELGMKTRDVIMPIKRFSQSTYCRAIFLTRHQAWLAVEENAPVAIGA